MVFVLRKICLAAAITLAGCADEGHELLQEASLAYKQYTGEAPGAPIVFRPVTTASLPETYPQDVNNLREKIAARVAEIESYDVTVARQKDREAHFNALKLLTRISSLFDNPPPELPANPSPVTEVMVRALREAERDVNELVGEQVIAGLQFPESTAEDPKPGELIDIQERLLFQANKAIVNGDTTRADLIRIDAVTVGNYSRQVGASISEHLIPLPNPTQEVPVVLSEIGIFGVAAQALRDERKQIDSKARFLPEDCDNIGIDEQTCTINPSVLFSPKDAVPITPVGYVLPSLAEAANTVVSEINSTIEGFLNTPRIGPLNWAVVSKAATLEVEAAQVLVYFNYFEETAETRIFTERVKKAQMLVTVLAALLELSSPTDPASFPTPNLVNIEIDRIPLNPPLRKSTLIFTDTRSPSYTLDEALIEGSISAERLVARIVGENFLKLYRFDSQPTELPSEEAVERVFRNYEYAAIDADNNVEPDRAALLRMIGHGFALSNAWPEVLAAPEATAVIKDTRSQAGFAASIAQRINERRRDVDTNDDLLPAACDDTSWDSELCSLVP